MRFEIEVNGDGSVAFFSALENGTRLKRIGTIYKLDDCVALFNWQQRNNRLETINRYLIEACEGLISLDDRALAGEDVCAEWDAAFDAIRDALAKARASDATTRRE